jgi:NitT/TauT family transport system substrate-binding protein
VKDRPEDVQKIIDAWFMTMDFLKANPDRAIAIMAKKAGVSVAEYREYDAGTTLFTLQQNLTAFTSGNDMTHLDFAAKEVGEFMLTNDFIETPLKLDGVFEPKFVKAVKQ